MKVNAMAFKQGEVYDVVISHDDDCPLLAHTGACNCAPEFHNGRTGERYTPPAPAGCAKCGGNSDHVVIGGEDVCTYQPPAPASAESGE